MEPNSAITSSATSLPLYAQARGCNFESPGPRLPGRQGSNIYTSLVYFDRLCEELALTASIVKVKDVRDKGEALRLCTRQQRYSWVMQIQYAEIVIRAERRIGEMLREQNTTQRKQMNLIKGLRHNPRTQDRHWLSWAYPGPSPAGGTL